MQKRCSYRRTRKTSLPYNTSQIEPLSSVCMLPQADETDTVHDVGKCLNMKFERGEQLLQRRLYEVSLINQQTHELDRCTCSRTTAAILEKPSATQKAKHYLLGCKEKMPVLVFMKYHGKEQPSDQSRRKLKWRTVLFNMVWTIKSL